MSGLYLYAVVAPDTPPPAGPVGVDGAAVEAVVAPPLALWCSRMAAAPSATVERARQHHAVVEAAFATGETPLPVRYGQWVEGAEALERWLAERGGELAEALARVAGCAEFGVRVAGAQPSTAPAPASVAATPGRAHMERLAARAGERERQPARADAVLARLRAALTPLARAERVEPPGSGPGLVAVSHLVPRTHEQTYRDRVRDVRHGMPDLRFLVTGPWPPYSFGA